MSRTSTRRTSARLKARVALTALAGATALTLAACSSGSGGSSTSPGGASPAAGPATSGSITWLASTLNSSVPDALGFGGSASARSASARSASGRGVSGRADDGAHFLAPEPVRDPRRAAGRAAPPGRRAGGPARGRIGLAGRRTEARTPLRRALDLAERTGAAGLAAGVRRELLAAGARPRRAALTGPDALTGTERRVARLAADGLSNRQIAEHLFITQATVETHLRHVFRKLGITSRAGLGLADHGR